MDGDQRSFGRFCLDLSRRRLLRDEKPVRLGGRALDILCVLASAEGKVVSKDELMGRVWPGVVVEENNLHVHIWALRKALYEEENQQSYLVTVPSRGYRLVGLRNTGQQATPPGDRPSALPVTPASQPLVAPRLSIVVLPFMNLSDDREQQYFADGITEDLTTDLSRLENMFVISRNTAFTYRNKPIDTKRIGRELGVRYALEGSIQRSGDRLRISAQLIDAETDAHMWAERFEGNLSDLFALQDEVTRRIAVALELELVGIEAARLPNRPDALDYILKGRAELAKPPARDRKEKAISLFEQALALDPQSAVAQSWLASALAGRVMENRSESASADFERAEELIERALATSPRSPLAHFAKGVMLRAQGRADEAIPEFETAIGFDRNWTYAIFMLGQCKFLTGSIEEAIPAAEQAIRLSPRDPAIALWYWQIGMVHMLQSRIDEAIVWFERAGRANPGSRLPHAYLASACALKGEMARAAKELAEARRVTADDRYLSISRLKVAAYYGVPQVASLFDATYFAGLRKVGMPEE
jgi:TolB-like protein/Tfp pilus assembly protein PilF